MKSSFLSVVLSVCSLVTLAGNAQSIDNQGATKAAVLAKYHVTQATADFTDIVTAGDVITLLKSGLVMYQAENARNNNVSYHDGKLNAGGMTKFLTMGGSSSSFPVRTYVSGEKCWLVDVHTKDDGLYLQFMSDPINDMRYMGTIKFPVDKKQPWPAPDVMMARVAEVISASPAPPSEAPAPAEAPPPPPPAPIAPPPPPPDEPPTPPPTISLGMTKAAVQAGFGQPVRVVKLATKEIDYYKDMKVTFVNGKVTDVQ